MTIGLNIFIQQSGMLLQSDILDDIWTFLHLLLDPVLTAMQDVGLRRIVLSTIIWSFLVVCGLIYLVYEMPSLIKLIVAEPSSKQIKRHQKESRVAKSRAATDSAKRHQISRDKEQKEREKRAQAVRDTGVRVSVKIERELELLRLIVGIKNGSTSQIDMVVVDLELPTGIDAEVGSFRMQRLGSINAGESKAAIFLLRPRGGNPLDIGGYVEFLGASYEISKIPLPAPVMEEESNNE